MSKVEWFRGGSLAAEQKPIELLIWQGKILLAGERLEDEQVQAALAQVGADTCDQVDCNGMLLLPGMCDLHVHVRPAGGSAVEDLASASAAALAGGVTRMMAMPDGKPILDNHAAVQDFADLVELESTAKIYPSGAITRGFQGEALTDFHDLKIAGVKVLSDASMPIINPAVLRRAMAYGREFDMIFATHPEEPRLSGGACVNDGVVSYQLGLLGNPVCSEEIAVTRDIRLAESVGARVHIQTISSSNSVEIIRRAKQRGCEVSCEVTPHHLIFDQSAIGNYNTCFRVEPPLRLSADKDALLDGIRDGTIDCLVSDHSPQSAFSKTQAFAAASVGMIGLETSLLAIYHHFIKRGELSWLDLVRIFSINPRAQLGLEPITLEAGELAEFVIFDPNAETYVELGSIKSKSCNTPFIDQALSGKVIRTVFGS